MSDIPKHAAPPPGRGPTAIARRKAARLAAAQALYQIEIGERTVDATIAEFVDHRFGETIDGDTLVTPDPPLFTAIVRGTAERRGELDELLAEAASSGGRPGTVNRFEPLLRAILRASLWELLAEPTTPARIVIASAIDVTAAFFGEAEVRLVNGVLHRLGQRLRPGELDDTRR